MPLLPNYDMTEEEKRQLRGQAALAAGLGILGSGRRGGAALAQGGLLGLNAYSGGQEDLIKSKKEAYTQQKEYEKQEKALREESELRAILSDEKFMSALKGSPMLEQVSRLAAYNPDILKQLGGALTTPNDIVDAKDRAVPVNRFTGGPVEYGIPPSDIFTQGQQSARSRFEQEQQNYRHNTPQAESENKYTNIATDLNGVTRGLRGGRMEVIPSDSAPATKGSLEKQGTIDTLDSALENIGKLSSQIALSPRSTSGIGRVPQRVYEGAISYIEPGADQPLASTDSLQALIINSAEVLQRDSNMSAGDRAELKTAVADTLSSNAKTRLNALARIETILKKKRALLSGGQAAPSAGKGKPTFLGYEGSK